MDVSEVKVLARRANELLVVSAILMVLSGFAVVYSILVLTGKIEPNKDLMYVLYMLSLFGGRHRYRRFSNYYYHNPEKLAFWCALSYSLEFAFFFWVFIRRLSIPKVIIEYDDFGLYIYRKGMPVTLLRYEALWSTYVHEEVIDSYEDFDSSGSVSTKPSFWGLSATGAIRFEVPNGFITVSGISRVKEVEKEIRKMVEKNRQEFIDELEENIKENQRQRELEELAKHNPDT